MPKPARGNSTAPPWAALPRRLGELLRPHLPAVADQVIDAVAHEVSEYRRPLDGRFGANLHSGTTVALSRFCDLPGTSQPALLGDSRKVYVELGRVEMSEGRTLEALQAAYRLGARVSYRAFAEVAETDEVSAGHLAGLAEAMFAYIDELSAASVEGYAQEQADRAGERERRRRELAGLVLLGGADAAAVAELAQQVGWRVPELLAVVLFPGETRGLGARLGPDALIGEYAEHTAAALPWPGSDIARRSLGRTLTGLSAVVGPARPWREAPASLRMAALGLRLAERGVLTGDPIWTGDRAATLLMHRDPELVAELTAYRLAPLAAVKPATRERLAETLLAWLAHRGERQHIAAALHVHPQTVGYRLGQLRELFGDALDDPDARFELELALRATPPGSPP